MKDLLCNPRYLPADSSWYTFGRNGKDAPVQAGPKMLHLTDVPLDAIPMYVAGGSIVVLAPHGLQYSDMLPGGPLQVQIYAGGDAAFTLYEDVGACSLSGLLPPLKMSCSHRMARRLRTSRMLCAKQLFDGARRIES